VETDPQFSRPDQAAPLERATSREPGKLRIRRERAPSAEEVVNIAFHLGRLARRLDAQGLLSDPDATVDAAEEDAA
jgi:hypothetical protein